VLEIRTAGSVLLVDAGPDTARQMEREGSARVDRLLVTHTHADHVLGLDDLVHLREPRDGPLPVHAAPFHRDRIRQAFGHLVREGSARIEFSDWSPGTRLEVGPVRLEGFETGHRAEFPTTGVLVEHAGRRVAYATDMGALPVETRRLLRDVDLFVGDGTYLGPAGHGHPGTDAVLEEARAIRARAVALTHFGHSRATEEEAQARVGAGVRLLRDGDDL
jgi:phosphoribosyl 1,2-cyclic phosphate phosphodiesterase